MGEIFDLTAARGSGPPPVVALIAHDAKKDNLRRLVGLHRAIFNDLRLVATATTGRMLIDELELEDDLVATGPAGGDLQIGARIVEGRVDAAIFLRNPLTAHPQAIVRLSTLAVEPARTAPGRNRELLIDDKGSVP